MSNPSWADEDVRYAYKNMYYIIVSTMCVSITVQFCLSSLQGRTQSDHHWPQVSVPLISQPMVSYRKGRGTPPWGVR